MKRASANSHVAGRVDLTCGWVRRSQATSLERVPIRRGSMRMAKTSAPRIRTAREKRQAAINAAAIDDFAPEPRPRPHGGPTRPWLFAVETNPKPEPSTGPRRGAWRLSVVARPRASNASRPTDIAACHYVLAQPSAVHYPASQIARQSRKHLTTGGETHLPASRESGLSTSR